MRKLKKLFQCLSLVLLSAVVISMGSSDIYATRYSAKYHYSVSRDLSVYFKNSDEVIEKLRTRLKQRYRYITIEYTSGSDNMSDIEPLVSELFDLALLDTDSPDEGGYLACHIGGYTLDYSVQRNDGVFDYTVKLTPVYYTTKKQEQAVDDKVSEILLSLDIDDNTSDYEKIKRIYSYVKTTTSFDVIHIKNENHHLRSTAYSALVYHTAACQGYAAALYRLMRQAGIDCRVITGMSTSPATNISEYHAWNKVYISGEWKNIDVTWDSVNQNSDCFLISDDDFENHTPDSTLQ
ncbi:MAG: hypothetical protein IJ740_10315 [Ruminococcus sp.]|nr:hypothetical protein [Ruminococcus sp.]